MATSHLNVSNIQMCGCIGFESGTSHKSYCNRSFKNDTGLIVAKWVVPCEVF